MLNKYLKALKYKGGEYNPGDAQAFRDLVLYMEDEKIRFYPQENRGPLRDTKSPTWPSALAAYLGALGCPVPADDKLESSRRRILEWLAAHALGLVYADVHERANEAGSRLAPLPDPASRPFPGVHVPEVREAVASIAEVMRIAEETRDLDPPRALERIQSAYESRVRPLLEGQVKAAGTSAVLIEPEHFPLGFETGDAALDRAATVLRMLYVRDLRGLQSAVDRALVSVQELTADPRTDASKGKVGR